MKTSHLKQIYPLVNAIFIYFKQKCLLKPSDFVARLDKNLLRSYEDIVHNLETKREQLLDARGASSGSVQNGKIWILVRTKI